MVSITILIISLLFVAVAVWFISEQKHSTLKGELTLTTMQRDGVEILNEKLEEKLETAKLEITSLEKRNTELETRLSEQTANLKEQIELLNTSKEQMKLEFENLAQKIFEEKGKTFTEQNKANLDLILNPFKQQITDFKAKVEEVYVNEGKERFNLTDQIKKMHEAYESLSKEANNLVHALKADTKTQGDWGELNLRRILDYTGLKEGLHYFSQPNYQNEDGDNLRPDIVVNLPDNRQIIVDSKVSLVGYERYFNAETDADKVQGKTDHLRSIRQHITELSEKKYEDLKGINTLDFVLMFIPVEAAYFVAINEDPELYKQASAKKVLLVCPSTLLITLQLVGSLWRIDSQNKNVIKIADQGAKLYDKFCGFVEDLSNIKDSMDKVSSHYEKAWNKLTAGNGNLINQAQKLIDLGIKTKKKLPEHLLLEAENSENPAGLITDNSDEEVTILEELDDTEA
jgi:DNA recombination protein RmuC